MPYYPTDGQFGAGQSNPNYMPQAPNGRRGRQPGSYGAPRRHASMRGATSSWWSVEVLEKQLKEAQESLYEAMRAEAYYGTPATSGRVEALRQRIEDLKERIAQLREGAAQPEAATAPGGLTVSAEAQAGQVEDPFRLYPHLRRFLISKFGTREKGPLDVPAEWEAPTFDEGDYVSPEAAIQAALPRIHEEADIGIGKVGQHMGGLGIPMTSSGYQRGMLDVRRKESGDIAELISEKIRGAREAAAERRQRREEGVSARDLEAWRTHGAWQIAAQEREMQDLLGLLQMLRGLGGGMGGY